MAIDRIEAQKRNIVEKCISDMVVFDDGFWHYWIENKGALSSFALRTIADELDRINKPWQDQIDNDPALKESTHGSENSMEPFT